MSQQEKPVDSTAEEIHGTNERYDRDLKFRRMREERAQEREERLMELETRVSRITQIANVVSLGAVAVGMLAVSKRLDGIEALMAGLRQNGVNISVTTAKHLAEHAEELAGKTG